MLQTSWISLERCCGPSICMLMKISTNLEKSKSVKSYVMKVKHHNKLIMQQSNKQKRMVTPKQMIQP